MIDKKLEKMYDQVNQLENPLTPHQVVLLRKVVNKFKSKVRITEDKRKMFSNNPRYELPTARPILVTSLRCYLTSVVGHPRDRWCPTP